MRRPRLSELRTRLGPAALATVAAFPVVFAALVLAASPGHLLPGLPRYRFQALPGDAYGFYSCAREILSAARRDASLVGAVVVGALIVIILVRHRTDDRTVRRLAVCWAVGAVAAALAYAVRFTGAAQMGWPLVWSIPLAPLTLVGKAHPDEAFAVAAVISLLCNAVTVVATYVIARRVGLATAAAFGAASLVSLWPLLSLLTGPHASWNGTWQVWLGLSLYTEPLSTAAVAVSLALLLRDPLPPRAAVVPGFLLGLATFARNTDLFVVAVVLLDLGLRRRWQAAAAVAAAAAAWAPALLLFWPKGYPRLHPPVFPRHPFELSYASAAWAHSYLWHPAVLAVILPAALVGLLRLRRHGVVLGGAVGVTAAFYSFYELTPIHPRFLYVLVPLVAVLWVAGTQVVVGRLARR